MQSRRVPTSKQSPTHQISSMKSERPHIGKTMQRSFRTQKMQLSPIRKKLAQVLSETELNKTTVHNAVTKGFANGSSQSLMKMIRSTRSLNVTESTVNLSALQPPKRLPNKLTPVKRRDNSSDEVELPLPGFKVAQVLAHELTEFEQKEVLEYPEVYFVGKLTAKRVPCETKENHGFDDERGNYMMAYDDHLDYRYEIKKLLGRGSFGQVVECYDHKRKVMVAVKVVTNSPKFRKQSKVEVSILEFLNRSTQSEHIVRMKACFSFRNHICIVLELLSSNLYQLVKLNKHRGFSPQLVKRFTAQLVSSLVTLHSFGIAHCDLKPENVVLADSTRSLIKLVDFGSSCYENHTIYSYIQSRYYRAPEVILGLPYGCPIDMWSLGCIIIELTNGIPVMAGDNEYDQLLSIMEILGLPPQGVVTRSPRFHHFFKTPDEPIIKPNKKGQLRRPASLSLAEVVKTGDESLLDFIRRCLDWDAETRLTPEDAAAHPYVQEDLTSAKS